MISAGYNSYSISKITITGVELNTHTLGDGKEANNCEGAFVRSA
jgi:hypothetical protein